MSLDNFTRLLKADNGSSDTIKQNLLRNLSNELDDLEAQQERLYLFLENGTYSEDVFLKRNDALAERREKIKKSITKTKASISTADDYRQRIYMLENAIAALEDKDMSAKDKNDALKKVVDHIEYSNTAPPNTKYIPPEIKLDIFLRF